MARLLPHCHCPAAQLPILGQAPQRKPSQSFIAITRPDCTRVEGWRLLGIYPGDMAWHLVWDAFLRDLDRNKYVWLCIADTWNDKEVIIITIPGGGKIYFFIISFYYYYYYLSIIVQEQKCIANPKRMAGDGRGEKPKTKNQKQEKRRAKLFKQDSPSPCIGFVSLRYTRSCSYQGDEIFFPRRFQPKKK
ncbi:hypothetical protein ACKS0A_07616 [Histoplasma ohiense]